LSDQPGELLRLHSILNSLHHFLLAGRGDDQKECKWPRDIVMERTINNGASFFLYRAFLFIEKSGAINLKKEGR
jgi:hypothetical protein